MEPACVASMLRLLRHCLIVMYRNAVLSFTDVLQYPCLQGSDGGGRHAIAFSVQIRRTGGRPCNCCLCEISSQVAVMHL